MIRQKFFRGQRVKITDKMPECMRHFTCNCEAIIIGSYRDEYGGRDDRSAQQYDLLIINGDNVFQCAWYDESQLTLICNNRDAGEKIIQEHNET